jgi:Fe-S cluster assembly scaffold protein SufB
VDPELLKTFDKLGIPLNEQKRLANVAVDAVFDSVSIATTFRYVQSMWLEQLVGSLVIAGSNAYTAVNCQHKLTLHGLDTA